MPAVLDDLAARLLAARSALQSVDVDALDEPARAAFTAALAALDGGSAPRSMPADVGERAHRVAIEHLRACEEALGEECVSDDLDPLPPSPASAPFCGCDDCVVREILDAAWPVFEADALAARFQLAS